MDIESPHGVGWGLQEAKAPLGQARHIPGYIYTSPEVLEREKERVFLRDWLCVGRVEELAKPGDYMTLRLAGEPVIVARHEDGTINAFSNVCRHRGVEVAVGQGNLEEFTCPYHGWLYDLKGNLLGAPMTRGLANFDRKNCRLKPLLCETWGGFLFVSFDVENLPLETYIEDFAGLASNLGLEKCRLYEKFTIRLECNWKLAPENLADWYHIEVLHRESLGSYTPSNRVEFKRFARGSYSVHYASGPFAPNGKSLFGRIPWLDDKPDDYAFSFFLRPNLNFFARIDSFVAFTAWPCGPDACDLTVYMLFPEEWVGESDFADRAKVYSDWFKGFLQEDVDIVASLQRGLKSRRFEPGPMVLLEDPIHHMLNDYLNRLFEERPYKLSTPTSGSPPHAG